MSGTNLIYDRTETKYTRRTVKTKNINYQVIVVMRPKLNKEKV